MSIRPHFRLPYSRIRHITVAVLVCAAAALSLMGSAPSASAATYHPSIATLSDWSNKMLAVMNGERLRNHVHSLHMNSNLVWGARSHDIQMAKYNTMSHRLPGEADLAPRIVATGYATNTGANRWCLVAENVAWTTDISWDGRLGVRYLQQYMYNERPPENGHRLNILNPRLVDVGIRITYDSTHKKLWITQDFARRAVNGSC